MGSCTEYEQRFELNSCFAGLMHILTGRSRSLLEKLSVDDMNTSTNLKWDKRSPWVEYSKPHPRFSWNTSNRLLIHKP